LKTIIPPVPAEDCVPFGDSRLLGRFWAKTQRNPESGCWEWTGQRSDRGYALIKLGGRMRRAHRLAYETLIGSVQDGLVLDHLCRVRHCVNPAHLEPVTCAENTRRGEAPSRKGWRLNPKPNCPQGHPFDAANTYIRPNNGRRMCRTCMRIRKQRNQQAKRAAVKGGAR